MEPRHPLRIDEPEFNEIPKVGAVLISPSRELDLHECFQSKNSETPCLLGCLEGGVWGRFSLSDPLASEEDVDGVPDRPIRPVQEDIEPTNVSVVEACPFQDESDPVQVRAVDHHVHMWCVANGRFIDGRDPRRDGVTACDGVAEPRLIQSATSLQ